ncbi:MAG: hypothetical protein AAGG01_01095 [Planctomycetota bacterium]
MQARRVATTSRLRNALWASVLVVAALVLPACGSKTVRWQSSWTSAYSRFTADSRSLFESAIDRLRAGERLAARTDLAALAQAEPDNLELGAWLQDVEAELLDDGVDLFATSFSLEEHLAPDVLRLVYAARKEVEPTVTSFVLAARAETDVIAAESLLERALELDPTCAWAHYGRSHVLLMDRSRSDRWGLAGDALERALEFDSGHLRARRLEAWMRAEEGSKEAATQSLLRWLELVDGDARVADSVRTEALLDLALLFLLDGENRRAERILEDLEGEPLDRQRRNTLLAVARQEAGDELGALDAALRAQGVERQAALPLMQEALLMELFLDNPAAAEARWRDVASLAGESTDIGDLVRGLRARVRLERAARERGQAAGGDITAGSGPSEARELPR